MYGGFEYLMWGGLNGDDPIPDPDYEDLFDDDEDEDEDESSPSDWIKSDADEWDDSRHWD